MKKLFILGALAVGLSFPLTSQAEVNAFGVTLPLERNEVSSRNQGGYVAENLMDTFKVQKLQNQELNEVEESEEFESVYSVFGINVSGDQVI